jgi:hypothetical protein
MSINWQQVGSDVEKAVAHVLGASWQRIASTAGPQLEAMVKIGKRIEQDHEAKRITEREYKMLRSMQKNALEGILSAYEAIGIVAAEEAADAAWRVVASALLKAGLAFA